MLISHGHEAHIVHDSNHGRKRDLIAWSSQLINETNSQINVLMESHNETEFETSYLLSF